MLRAREVPFELGFELLAGKDLRLVGFYFGIIAGPLLVVGVKGGGKQDERSLITLLAGKGAHGTAGPWSNVDSLVTFSIVISALSLELVAFARASSTKHAKLAASGTPAYHGIDLASRTLGFVDLVLEMPLAILSLTAVNPRATFFAILLHGVSEVQISRSTELENCVVRASQL